MPKFTVGMDPIHWSVTVDATDAETARIEARKVFDSAYDALLVVAQKVADDHSIDGNLMEISPSVDWDDLAGALFDPELSSWSPT